MTLALVLLGALSLLNLTLTLAVRYALVTHLHHRGDCP